MATRLQSATTLDLSRFPPPLAIRGINYESILVDRKARFVALMKARGIDYTVADLETDSAVVLEETDAYREMLTLARINDSVRAVMVAFAAGTDLDFIADSFSLGLAAGQILARRTIKPATETEPAVMESDDEFRRRILLSPEAYGAAGPRGAYIFHALSSDPRVLNVDVWSEVQGRVMVAVQSREGDGTADEDLLQNVRLVLNRDDIRPLTDVVSVLSVTNIPYSISLEAFVLPGPDPLTLKSLIETSVLAAAAARRTPARDVPRSALIGAAQLQAVDKVILATPAADIARGYGEVGVLSSLNVAVTTYAG